MQDTNSAIVELSQTMKYLELQVNQKLQEQATLRARLSLLNQKLVNYTTYQRSVRLKEIIDADIVKWEKSYCECVALTRQFLELLS